MGEARIIVSKRKSNSVVLKDRKKKRKMKRRYGAGTDYPTVIKRGLIPEHNYLKYWRVVRYWALKKYEISQEELEILLYLYDEDLFTRDGFVEFEGLLTWDKSRFDAMQRKGWITVWRPNNGYKGKKVYTLSVQAKRICNTVYKKLLQEEQIPENGQNNPIFRGNSYMDRKYRSIIQKMNRRKADNMSEENP